jgi:hypothetical protein
MTRNDKVTGRIDELVAEASLGFANAGSAYRLSTNVEVQARVDELSRAA